MEININDADQQRGFEFDSLCFLGVKRSMDCTIPHLFNLGCFSLSTSGSLLKVLSFCLNLPSYTVLLCYTLADTLAAPGRYFVSVNFRFLPSAFYKNIENWTQKQKVYKPVGEFL